MELGVRGGHVLVDGEVRRADLGIEDGTIVAIGNVARTDREVDATDCLVLPGLVNAHTHSPMTLLRGYADDVPLQTWLEDLIWPVEGVLEADDIAAGTRLAAVEMIRTGTTAFADMYFGMPAVAEAVADAGLRAVLGYGMITVGKDEEAARAELEEGLDFVSEHDGSAGGRVRGMVTPHAPYTCDDWLLEAAAERARALGRPFHVHLSETTNEVDDIVDATGERPAHHLDDLGCWEGPGFVAHGVHLDGSERRLLADRGIGVAHCPSANMKLAAGVAPVPALLDAGVPVALGTDGPASNNTLDLFSEMRHAALLAKVHAGDAAAVPAPTVVEMATTTGAELLGLPGGRIVEGAAADLAILDLDAPHLTPRHDLLSHVVYAATGADVTTTIVEGDVLMEGGEMLTMDADAVMAEAQDRAEAVVARASET